MLIPIFPRRFGKESRCLIEGAVTSRCGWAPNASVSDDFSWPPMSESGTTRNSRAALRMSAQLRKPDVLMGVIVAFGELGEPTTWARH